MGIAAYTQPDAGYCTAWPPADLGPDLAVALHRARIRAADLGTSAAFGWAAVPLDAAGHPRPGAVRIMAPDADTNGARAVALGLLPRGPVALCKAVAHAGPLTVWARVERLDVGATVPPGAEALGAGGARLGLSKAAAGPKFGVDVQALARKLATELHTPQVSTSGLAAVREALAALDLNWSKATKIQIDQAFTHARHALSQIAAATGGQLLPEWNEKIRVSLLNTATAARKWQHDYYYPRIGLSLRQPDQLAIAQVSQQQGWFLRDEMGTRSDKITAAGRKIVEVGVREGWGRDAIGKALQGQLPELWGAHGFNYARTVASVAVNRARAFSEASGYQDAGIDSLEIVAMLDERTTDICRCMDGQILPVGGCYAHAVEAASVAKPEDIYKVSPFMRTKWDPKAEAFQVSTRLGAKIATVSRSGVGAVDDRGDFAMHAAGPGLLDQKIGLPPYHFQCRTTTVPRITSVQVPKGEIPVAAPVPAQPPTPAPPVLAPPFMDALGAGHAAAPTALPAQRPIVSMATPTAGHPATVPSLPAVEPGPVVNPTPPGGPGASGQVKTLRQVLDETKAALETMYEISIGKTTPTKMEFDDFGAGLHVFASVEAQVSVQTADLKGWNTTRKGLGYGVKLSPADGAALQAQLKAEGWTLKEGTWAPPPKPPKAVPPPSPVPDATPAQGSGTGPPPLPAPAASKYIDGIQKWYFEIMDQNITITKYTVGVKNPGEPNEKYFMKAWGSNLKREGIEFTIKTKAEYEAIKLDAIATKGVAPGAHVPPPAVAPPGVVPAKAVALPETPILDNAIGAAIQDLEAQVGVGKFKIHGVKLPTPGKFPAAEVLYTVGSSEVTHHHVLPLNPEALKMAKAEAKKLAVGKKGGWAIAAEKIPAAYRGDGLTFKQKVWMAEAKVDAERRAARAIAEGKPPPIPRDTSGPDYLGPIRAVPVRAQVDPRSDLETAWGKRDKWVQHAHDSGQRAVNHVQKHGGVTYIGDVDDYAGQVDIWKRIGGDADEIVRKHFMRFESEAVGPGKWEALTEDQRLAYRYRFGASVRGSWNGDSMDTKTDMHALHLAAREEFGLLDAATAPLRKPVVDQVYAEYTPGQLFALRKYLRGMYESTQAELAKNGIKTVRVYRGMSISKSWEQPTAIDFTGEGKFQVGNLALQPVSSFSSNPATSYSFAHRHDHGMFIQVEVDARRVLGMGSGALGTAEEIEFCLLGGKGEVGGVFWDASQSMGRIGESRVFDLMRQGNQNRFQEARQMQEKGVAA